VAGSTFEKSTSLADNPFPIELVNAARTGDRDALNTLLNAYANRAFMICRRIVPNDQDAQDATQEALIAIARSITRFDGAAAFTTWAYRITVNAALDEVRRTKRRPVPDAELEPAPAPDPTDAVDARITLDAALEQLLPEFRAALVLRDLGGLDYEQIATMLEIPPGTVRSRIARGRAQLAAALGNQDHDDERQRDTP
jgi:RNA polymerase sigma-70 factor (ECF subfamily)